MKTKKKMSEYELTRWIMDEIASSAREVRLRGGDDSYFAYLSFRMAFDVLAPRMGLLGIQKLFDECLDDELKEIIKNSKKVAVSSKKTSEKIKKTLYSKKQQ